MLPLFLVFCNRISLVDKQCLNAWYMVNYLCELDYVLPICFSLVKWTEWYELGLVDYVLVDGEFLYVKLTRYHGVWAWSVVILL